MAKNVTVVTLGQSPLTSDRDAKTVGELATSLGLSDNLAVKINGETATYDTALADYAFVSFGEKVKGGRRVIGNSRPFAEAMYHQLHMFKVLDSTIQA